MLITYQQRFEMCMRDRSISLQGSEQSISLQGSEQSISLQGSEQYFCPTAEPVSRVE